jgi:hypothetical protein
MLMPKQVGRLIGISLLLFSPGCHSQMDASVQGTVTIDGVLADHGTVAFYPSGEGAPAYGTVAKNGSYSLRVGQGNLRDEDASKIRSGEYTVTVVVNALPADGETMGPAGPPKPGPRVTAEKYSKRDSSPLHVSVSPGPNVLPLELESAAAAGDAPSPDISAAPAAAQTPDQTAEPRGEPKP